MYFVLVKHYFEGIASVPLLLAGVACGGVDLWQLWQLAE